MGGKTDKKLLLRLARSAHDEELRRALERLFSRFQDWKAGKLTNEGMNQAIHEHHDGASRRIYKRYTMGMPEAAVAYAIARKIIPRDGIPVSLMQELASVVSSFESSLEWEEGEPPGDGWAR